MPDHVLVASDVHVGSCAADEAAFLRFLRSLPGPCDALVVAGDLWHSPASMTDAGWRIADELRDLARRVEVVLMPGNHDPHAPVVACLLGCHYEWDGYTFVQAGDTFHVRHGHRGPDGTPWDRYLGGYKAPTAFGDQFESDLGFYGGVVGRWLASRGHRLRKWVCDVRSQVRTASIRLAQERGYRGIVVGHTHLPEVIFLPGTWYANAGSWCEGKNTFVVVEGGRPRLVDEFA